MISRMLYEGYNNEFIPGLVVSLPELNQEQSGDVVLDKEGNNVLRYINYSLQLSASHKFPFYTATNIDGLLFKKVPRRDYWRKDERVQSEFQFGKELYSASFSRLDRGHLTKREDVQWGKTAGIALNAAESTFYYTNAVPQHKDLNRDVWRSLEDYILHTEAKQNELKICVFTGPVLSSSNPFLITPIQGRQVQIPILFWKVVVYQKEDGRVYRVGFLMSQNKLLLNDNIIEELESGTSDDLFLQFDDAETYQVNISLIEELSGLKLPKAIDAYSDARKTQLILNAIDIDPDLESDSHEYRLGFKIENLSL